MIDNDAKIITSLIINKKIQEYKAIKDRLGKKKDNEGVKHYEKIINALEDTLGSL